MLATHTRKLASYSDLRSAFVELIYADHNASRAVRTTLNQLLGSLKPADRALNVGAGSTRLSKQVINLDVVDGPMIDVVGSALSLPFGDEHFALVVTQEVLEHVSDPDRAMREISRVLHRGGRLYCQLPFVIGYHPGPTDYWRFTVQGISELVISAGLVVERQGITVGGASGYYRISVEFWSILLTFGRAPFYKVAKGLFALLFYPIKWCDAFIDRTPERDRIAGGYYVVALKPNEPTLNT